jgi:hypothetical protein
VVQRIGTYNIVYGGGTANPDTTGHKFLRGGGELIAQIGYGASGTPANRLDSYFAGRVGIGIAPSSTYALTVKSAGASGGDALRVQNSTGQTMQLWAGSSGVVIDAEGTMNLHLRTGGTDKLFIEHATGEVGIGNIAPAYKLDVTGTIRATSHIYANGNIEMGASGVINHNTALSYDKIRVNNNSTYTLGYNSSTYGFLTAPSLTFTSSSIAGSGFLWRSSADATTDGAMSLATDGKLYVKSTVNSSIITARTSMTSPAIWGDVVEGSSIYSYGDLNVDSMAYISESVSYGGKYSDYFVLPVGVNKYATV